MFSGNSALTQANSIDEAQKAKPISTAEIVAEYYKDTPVLIEVAKCESGTIQFTESGQVLRGKVDRRDVGVMQINEYYHLDTSKRMGLDIETLEGNLAYGKYLYKKQGLEPWKASSACWSKTASAKQLAMNTQ